MAERKWLDALEDSLTHLIPLFTSKVSFVTFVKKYKKFAPESWSNIQNGWSVQKWRANLRVCRLLAHLDVFAS